MLERAQGGSSRLGKMPYRREEGLMGGGLTQRSFGKIGRSWLLDDPHSVVLSKEEEET
jgi:hypothetical protein